MQQLCVIKNAKKESFGYRNEKTKILRAVSQKNPFIFTTYLYLNETNTHWVHFEDLLRVLPIKVCQTEIP
jgi:hypothetical protein